MDPPADQPQLRVASLGKTFSRNRKTVHALQDVSFDVPRGQFLSILGPSGCGKSTLLHIIGGFEQASSGSLLLDGRPVAGPGRDRGMMFQQATLFPWKTIESNVAWPFIVDGHKRGEARERAHELLATVGLSGFERSYPAELSGGMRQRAALARTLGLSPDILLMDEPFGALDAQTRELMQEELTRIWEHSGLTVIFITHDIDEAVFLGDRVLVMGARPGRIIADVDVELGRPRGTTTKKDPQMAEYHSHFWELIRQEAGPQADRNGGSDRS
ncbi:ABC transporter ATP-binding protein [Haloechinothrix sp. YIM 98757]|uniref:ABC transporter ATP-binding protein n=1 Tax=Haloechinothrix aidingensis TaxID=2752311 RepID=A0A838AAY2_9PSEU|nr:ABC transporter ATP-binding protein [Haloechinothrix aidingensis]MBA0126401.1 ABC transporter ATP-binding protein [Haloechinothrix aidingensis]